MSDSYPFPMYSGLLEPEHYKNIGSAIWLFLWCISSTTKEIERDGVTWGIVLGNKPIKQEEIAPIFGVNKETIGRWLKTLEVHDYIRITRAPYGSILSVRHSKKFKNRQDKNVVSVESDTTNMSILSNRETTIMLPRNDKTVVSNKDITRINKKNTITKDLDPVDDIANRYADLRTAREGKPCYPSVKDYEAIAQIIARAVPPVQIIKLLEQCFDDYGRRNPKGSIKAFSYCEKYILDHYEALQAKEEAKKLAKRRETGEDGKGKIHQSNHGKYNFGTRFG